MRGDMCCLFTVKHTGLAHLKKKRYSQQQRYWYIMRKRVVVVVVVIIFSISTIYIYEMMDEPHVNGSARQPTIKQQTHTRNVVVVVYVYRRLQCLMVSFCFKTQQSVSQSFRRYIITTVEILRSIFRLLYFVLLAGWLMLMTFISHTRPPLSLNVSVFLSS